jgi:ribosomal protein L39E
MKKSPILLMLILITTLSVSACSKNINVNNTLDDLAEKVELQQKLDLLEQQKNNFTIPNWVRELNIFSPKWMILKTGDSYQTTQEVDGFNSMHFVYKWEYDTAMQQAEQLARRAGISVSEEFQMAQDVMKKMWSDASDEMKKLAWDLKWVVYSNYSITKNPDSDHIISISVDEDGTMEVVVTDRKNMQEIAKDKIDLINN